MRTGSMLACLFTVLALASPAASEAPSPEDAPCRADAERYCASVERGQGARSRCLQEHLAELSSECRARVEARPPGGRKPKRVGGLDASCAADLSKHCPDESRHGARVRCLRAHRDELSEKCAERLEQKRGRKKAQPEG